MCVCVCARLLGAIKAYNNNVDIDVGGTTTTMSTIHTSYLITLYQLKPVAPATLSMVNNGL